MALEEAKLMGLDLIPDPERNGNAPRNHRSTATNAASTSNYYHNWSSSDNDSGSDSESEAHARTPLTKGGKDKDKSSKDQDCDDEEEAYDALEAGGLTDREIDRLDGKTSTRLGRSKGGGGGPSGPSGITGGYPERETGANTGPKGVIADRNYHHQQQLQEHLSSQQAYNERMLAKAPMTTTYQQDKERERQEKIAQGVLDKDDEEDKTTLEKLRGDRLRELTGGKRASQVRKKMFGYLVEMNSTQYVDAIDAERKDVAIVIHIYSEYNPACKKLDGCLIQLAGRYATTKFIRIKARELDFDEEVCPTVLVYRAGDLIANLVMITFELSENYDDIEVEELLTKNKVLSPHDRCQREMSFFESSLDTSSFNVSSVTGELNMMSLGLGVGDGVASASSGARRGILSGNVREFRYQDLDDDDDE
ncbi:hypothetical protein BGZ65_003467 [Modicella reniformis]|uniref:Phosducin domain-containing protein n=1 Tax=Modicella reniformis TaxID=1440133 RepID=A0A9P6M9C8_9FUNG|nr:hypothetical protein BGZ65_003467 [Modicella reniformis]